MTVNAVFEALANPVRRDVLSLLKAGPLNAGEIADRFELTKPTMSVHLAKLREAGLVTVERRGTSLIYHLNLSILEDALSGLLSVRSRKK